MNVIEEEGSSAAKQILEIALRENVNTIVVGSRGQSYIIGLYPW